MSEKISLDSSVLNKFKTVSKLIYTILKGRKSPITPARENQAFLNEL